MSNEKHQKYYTTTPEKKNEICELYEAVKILRDKVMQGIFDKTGAVAFAQSGGWGLPERVTGLVFPYGHEMTNNPHYKTKLTVHNGKDVVIVEGKSNRKDGAEFNRMISAINKDLKELPTFKDFIIDHLGIRQTGLGGASNRGVSMLSTNAGLCGDVILASIPFPGDSKIAIPECLEEITYGKFYDMVNGK